MKILVAVKQVGMLEDEVESSKTTARSIRISERDLKIFEAAAYGAVADMFDVAAEMQKLL